MMIAMPLVGAGLASAPMHMKAEEHDALSPMSDDRAEERRRKPWKTKRSPRRTSDDTTSSPDGIVFRLAVGWAQLSGADGSEVIAREYVRNGGGGSAKQKLERRVQQRRKGEGRETSLSSSISSVLKAAGFGSTVYGLDVFDESGRRRSARERKQVELENIDHEPPKQRVRRNTLSNDSDDSSDSPDGDGRPGAYRKECASCHTRKTPMWRDAPDGVPYCNACGIRYKKYRVRCNSCFYIPRKDEKLLTACSKCGDDICMTAGR